MNIVGSAYCPVDQRQVPVAAAERHGTNHVLHLLLTVFTLGLWAIVWIIVAIANSTTGTSHGTCTYCGQAFQFVNKQGWVPLRAAPGWYLDAQGQERWWTGAEWGERKQLPPP